MNDIPFEILSVSHKTESSYCWRLQNLFLINHRTALERRQLRRISSKHHPCCNHHQQHHLKPVLERRNCGWENGTGKSWYYDCCSCFSSIIHRCVAGICCFIAYQTAMERKVKFFLFWKIKWNVNEANKRWYCEARINI